MQKYDQKIKCFQSDNGEEYEKNKSHAWFKKTGIQWEPTVPYAPDQNKVSKQINRTLIDRVWFVLYAKNLDKALWAKVAKSIDYLKNRSPTTRLFSIGWTLHKTWYRKKEDFSYLQVLGCRTYVHISKKNWKKLDSNSKKGVSVGYSGSNIYRVWDPEKADVIQAWDVIPDENFQITELSIFIEHKVGEKIIKP